LGYHSMPQRKDPSFRCGWLWPLFMARCEPHKQSRAICYRGLIADASLKKDDPIRNGPPTMEYRSVLDSANAYVYVQSCRGISDVSDFSRHHLNLNALNSRSLSSSGVRSQFKKVMFGDTAALMLTIPARERTRSKSTYCSRISQSARDKTSEGRA